MTFWRALYSEDVPKNRVHVWLQVKWDELQKDWTTMARLSAMSRRQFQLFRQEHSKFDYIPKREK